MKKAGNPTFPKKKDETTEAPNGIEKKKNEKEDEMLCGQIDQVPNLGNIQ